MSHRFTDACKSPYGSGVHHFTGAAGCPEQAALVAIPSEDLPETADMPADLMYPHWVVNRETHLYLEQKAKNRIVVLTVPRPSKIRQETTVALDVASPFDFVRTIPPLQIETRPTGD